MAKSFNQLRQLADEQFKTQSPMLQLWQTIAENFYPERADFTLTRNLGNEFADQLVDSTPVMARRDLCNSYAAMLRDGDWFEMTVRGEIDQDGKEWLEWATERMYSFIRDRSSNFVRATKEGDHDFGSFGQAVLTVEQNPLANGMLYRCWHLRDCAWWDGVDGQVEGVVRKWKPTQDQLYRLFGDKCDKKLCKDRLKNPHKKINIRHIFMPAYMYEDDSITNEFVSVYIDLDHQHVIEAVGMNRKMYAIPRFHTIAGHAYAYSPASISALPNARTLQAMTFTILEAGERVTRPPMIAQENVVRGDVDLSSDGITYIDAEYDEKMGEALRVMNLNTGGLPTGFELRQNTVEVISDAFYLNKITLPDTGREMTAYEVKERMDEYRRANLPLFAPMEEDYNGQLCEMTFLLMLDGGFLGAIEDIPKSLQGKDVEFKFRSPLSASEKERKANQFQQVAGLLEMAAQYDDQVIDNVDIDEAFRDAVDGVDSPEKWLRSVDEVTAHRQAEAMAMAQQQLMEAQQGVTEEGGGGMPQV